MAEIPSDRLERQRNFVEDRLEIIPFGAFRKVDYDNALGLESDGENGAFPQEKLAFQSVV